MSCAVCYCIPAVVFVDNDMILCLCVFLLTMLPFCAQWSAFVVCSALNDVKNWRDSSAPSPQSVASVAVVLFLHVER